MRMIKISDDIYVEASNIVGMSIDGTSVQVWQDAKTVDLNSFVSYYEINFDTREEAINHMDKLAKRFNETPQPLVQI